MNLNPKRWKLSINPLLLRVPNLHWPQLRVPTIKAVAISGSRVKWAIVTSICVAVGAVAFGTLLAVKDVASNTYEWPEPGATYDASITYDMNRDYLPMGEKFPETSPYFQSQTLNLITNGARIGSIAITDVSVGKASGLTTSVTIKGVGGVTPASLFCEKLTIDGLVAPSLNITDSEFFKITLLNNRADGNSFASTLDAAVINYTQGSDRGTVSVPSVSGDTYDEIVIDSTGADSFADQISLTNVSAFGGPVTVEFLKCGELLIQNSMIGDGTGINSASFTIASSVKLGSGSLTSTNNVEEPIKVQ